MTRIFDNLAFSSFSLQPPVKETLALSSQEVFSVATSIKRDWVARKA